MSWEQESIGKIMLVWKNRQYVPARLLEFEPNRIVGQLKDLRAIEIDRTPTWHVRYEDGSQEWIRQRNLICDIQDEDKIRID